MSNTVLIKMEKPDWLEIALPEVIKGLQLIQNSTIPECLHGRFLVSNALRLLRCVYGSDQASAVAIREIVLADTDRWQKLEAMTPAEIKAYFAQALNEANAAVGEGIAAELNKCGMQERAAGTVEAEPAAKKKLEKARDDEFAEAW